MRLTSTRLDVTPISMLERKPERSSPFQRSSPSVGAVGEVLGQRGDLEDVVVLEVVGLGHHPSEPGLGEEVVRPVHAQEVVDQERLDLLDVVRRAPDEGLGVVGQGGAVAVADGEVLGPHGGAVGRLPPEAASLVTAEGTPRHTTVWANPAWRRIWGIWAMCPNMSGR